MEFETLTIASPQRQLAMCSLRGLFFTAKIVHFIMVLSCTFFWFTACGPCSLNGMKSSTKYDACGAYNDNHVSVLQDVITGDPSTGYVPGSPMTPASVDSFCTDSRSFCFHSTMPGFLNKNCKFKAAASEIYGSNDTDPLSLGSTHSSGWASNRSWSTDNAAFAGSNGKTISCSLSSKKDLYGLAFTQTDGVDRHELSTCEGPLQNPKSMTRLRKDSEHTNTDIHVASPSVDISPPLLDWGEKNLYYPSVAFLTVKNIHNDSILHIYEPFSTNIQFYPCNFSEAILEPGEVASICFVFLPRFLGMSSSHLILQTSCGGFLVLAKGFAIESPYEIQPLLSIDVLPDGRLRKNLSLFNPFNETLFVKEVTARLSVYQGNTSHLTETTCSIDKLQESNELLLPSIRDWLVLKKGQGGFPLMAIRPHENWEFIAHKSGIVLEVDLSYESEGKIIGAICMKLVRSSQDQSDTVVVPIEVNLNGKAPNDDIEESLSVYLEAVVPCDATGTVVSISLKNGGPDMLSVLKVSGIATAKDFQIKYVEGLLLFPGTATQVAVINCTELAVELIERPLEFSKTDTNCKLLILTNDSSSSETVIPCRDIIYVCSRHQNDSSFGHRYLSREVGPGNMRTGSLENSLMVPSPIKALETVEADESVLGNWKSQGTTTGMSVLDDHEILFPMVQVGTHGGKWINVNNPSHQPVVMQLILNSGGEIVDECNVLEGSIQSPSSGGIIRRGYTAQKKYGFSIGESALTEAFVHPHGIASFGPIFFHPSDRCRWRSSVLIRNNLSGVEWLSLRGYGGSVSLTLLEGSEPVQSVEFNMKLPTPLNISPPDILFHVSEMSYACSQPLTKELFAKNTGDLPLEVKSIKVSGTECWFDGFLVHTCKGFFLDPGESVKLLITYRTDFSAVMVRRDLELALASGYLVIPMKASLPFHTLNLCKKSVFWMRLRKFSVAVLIAVSFMFLVFCCVYPQVTVFSSQDYLYRSEKRSITSKRSDHRNNKFPASISRDCLFRSVQEYQIMKQTSVCKYLFGQGGVVKEGMAAHHEKPILENHRNIFLEAEKDKAFPSPQKDPAALENSVPVDASHTGNLVIRIGKEKRKRRKRKGVVGTGLIGQIEVSSSHSGNSTPSSPLSPVISVTPSRAHSLSPDVDPVGTKNHFTKVIDQHSEKSQISEPTAKATVFKQSISSNCCSDKSFASTTGHPSSLRETVSKPVLLPSATFPGSSRAAPIIPCSSPLSSKSALAPHARAPGPKLCNQKTMKVEEKVGDEYEYNIWDDHLSRLHFMGVSKNITTMSVGAREENSYSFFVRGPEAFITKPQQKYVSCFKQEG
ncbi:hypothetical protein HS088_TW14G00259 [Tripterygium wilfordii]|uniref:Transmembrane protein n=1 Tax=Tripterygium wilfordii TaxID=458696 RepID=A0A7J7CPY5_TRIWF|nr:uncharacterized protein LOC120014985 [Tripterygium wilfordii]KAF5736124.1 hypothetical protein HS088_TW14G00259 [Tripterygium wilfordii]